MQFENLDFLVMNRLLKKAGELDEELRLFKTSKEAKQALAKENLEKHKAKKGQLRWQDPW